MGLQMCSDIVVQAENLSKSFRIYEKPHHRLKQTLWRGRKQFYRDYFALSNATFSVYRGETIGVIGQNGAGKSTILQLITGILQPTSGTITAKGRVAALLELGAGFNPRFTGKENVYMNAAILGLSKAEIDERYQQIVEFADIGEFIHQQVRTYSSGMRVRLAFAVAVNVEPEILIVDEALSVGDNAFSRKSFNKILDLKKRGITILFCSHSMFQIEAMCDRTIWIHRGEIRRIGNPKDVVTAYQQFMDQLVTADVRQKESKEKSKTSGVQANQECVVKEKAYSKIETIEVSVDGKRGNPVKLVSRDSELSVSVTFKSPIDIPSPHIGMILTGHDGKRISSVMTAFDDWEVPRNQRGQGGVRVVFPHIPLLKGDYNLNVYLMCENGINVLEAALNVCEIQITQEDLVQGIVELPHIWRNIQING